MSTMPNSNGRAELPAGSLRDLELLPIMIPHSNGLPSIFTCNPRRLLGPNGPFFIPEMKTAQSHGAVFIERQSPGTISKRNKNARSDSFCQWLAQTGDTGRFLSYVT